MGECIYHPGRSAVDGKRVCSDCVDYHRAWSLQKKYGITMQEYGALLADQGGVCAICSATEPGGRSGEWHVDHDHQTGKVRGLLCTRCNLGLGYFKDNPAALHGAKLYLERNNA